MNRILPIILFLSAFIFSAQYPEPGTSVFSNDKDSPSVFQVKSQDKTYSMKLNIWGEVQKPGQYLIPYTMKPDLVSFISIAGGPRQYADLTRITVIRLPIAGGVPETYTFNLKAWFQREIDMENFILEPGDTVIIKKTFWGKLNSGSAIMNIFNLITTTYLIFNK